MKSSRLPEYFSAARTGYLVRRSPLGISSRSRLPTGYSPPRLSPPVCTDGSSSHRLGPSPETPSSAAFPPHRQQLVAQQPRIRGEAPLMRFCAPPATTSSAAAMPGSKPDAHPPMAFLRPMRACNLAELRSLVSCCSRSWDSSTPQGVSPHSNSTSLVNWRYPLDVGCKRNPKSPEATRPQGFVSERDPFPIRGVLHPQSGPMPSRALTASTVYDIRYGYETGATASELAKRSSRNIRS